MTVKLLDGSTFTIGSLAQLVSILKEKMEELQGIPACDQRLFFLQEADGMEIELSEDWRTLAGCRVKKETTLLLMQRQSQQYDPSTKTLTLLLPDICARLIVAIVLRIAHCINESFRHTAALVIASVVFALTISRCID